MNVRSTRATLAVIAVVLAACTGTQPSPSASMPRGVRVRPDRIGVGRPREPGADPVGKRHRRGFRVHAPRPGRRGTDAGRAQRERRAPRDTACRRDGRADRCRCGRSRRPCLVRGPLRRDDGLGRLRPRGRLAGVGHERSHRLRVHLLRRRQLAHGCDGGAGRIGSADPPVGIRIADLVARWQAGRHAVRGRNAHAHGRRWQRCDAARPGFRCGVVAGRGVARLHQPLRGHAGRDRPRRPAIRPDRERPRGAGFSGLVA